MCWLYVDIIKLVFEHEENYCAFDICMCYNIIHFVLLEGRKRSTIADISGATRKKKLVSTTEDPR